MVGSAIENKAGYLENVTGDITLSGKDKNGVQHDLNLNVIVKLSEVGNTKITMPDLTGAKVEKVSYSNGFSSKYVGKYKTISLWRKDGKFVKIGERMLEITSVDNDKVKGNIPKRLFRAMRANIRTKMPLTLSLIQSRLQLSPIRMQKVSRRTDRFIKVPQAKFI